MLEALRLLLEPRDLLRHLADTLEDLALAAAAEVVAGGAAGGVGGGELLGLAEELPVGVDELRHGGLGVDHLCGDVVELGRRLRARPELADDRLQVDQPLRVGRQPLDHLLLPLPVWRLRGWWWRPRREEELLLVHAKILHHRELAHLRRARPPTPLRRRLALRRPEIVVIAIATLLLLPPPARSDHAPQPERRRLRRAAVPPPVVTLRRRRGGGGGGGSSAPVGRSCGLDEVELDVLEQAAVVGRGGWVAGGVAVVDGGGHVVAEAEEVDLAAGVEEVGVEVEALLLEDDAGVGDHLLERLDRPVQLLQLHVLHHLRRVRLAMDGLHRDLGQLR